ncbi:aldo/keto reductase [Candidatus Pelagibacter sp.]|nr:aldo/keto reductase [Candidatus Pelagibacter sp.]
MVKLCLGSANFGSRYGLDNKKINKKKILEIAEIAKINKLFTVDTSFEYFNSHQTLKKVINKKTNINTKIFLNKNSNFISVKKKILDFNKKSPSNIYSVLFHNQNDALQIKKIKLLKKLKAEGLVSKIGVSVYDLPVLKNILKLWIPDIVQFPVNPFNHDFISRNLLKKLKREKIIIFGRSIFLQGMLVKEYDSLAHTFKKDLKSWFNFCKSNSIHPVKVCLDFCRSIKEIDFLIIGVQDAEELKQIIRYFKQPKKISSKSIIKKKYKKIDLRKI